MKKVFESSIKRSANHLNLFLIITIIVSIIGLKFLMQENITGTKYETPTENTLIEKEQISQNILSYWEKQHEYITSKGILSETACGFNPRVYPAEAAISFISAYQVTGNVDYLEDAKRQLEFAHSLENSNNYIQLPPETISWIDKKAVGTNAQVRLILGYYLAYRGTDDKKYLKCADESMIALMRLQTTDYVYKGKVYKLFKYCYSIEQPQTALSGIEIDPNQQAFIGLTMTLLYHDKDSIFFHDSKIKTLALNQLEAALVLERPDGKLPLAESRINELDTRYGHLALMLVYCSNQFWNDTEFDTRLRNSIKWVASYTKLSTTDRYYPQKYYGKLPDPVEAYSRLPLIYAYGNTTDQKAIQDMLNEIWSRWPEFSEYPGGWSTPFVLYTVINMPKSYYWGF